MSLGRPSIVLVSCFAALLVSACGLFKQLEVESVATSTDKPSNVAVYLAVNEGSEPLTDLAEQNFSVFENEQPISPDEAKLVLLNRDIAAYHRVLLLVDMSVAGPDAVRQQLARAVAGFVNWVRKDQPLTVYAFDGSADIKLIGDYPKGETAPDSITEIANFKNIASSRNFHVAVIAGAQELAA